MRPEMFPTFRKLYAHIHSDFVKGDKVVINVTANFEVSSFMGEKMLILTNGGW